MVERRSNRGRKSGSKNGESNRTDYVNNKPGTGATQQSVSFKDEDEKIYAKFFEKEGLKRTEFVRAAIHSFKDQFEWQKARDEMRQQIDEQFTHFVERFGTAAEHERNILQQKHSEAAALTMVLYRFHLYTMHVRGFLSHVGSHPSFANDETLALACDSKFTGEWKVLFDTVIDKLASGDTKTLDRADRLLEVMFQVDPSHFDVLEDISAYYNLAVGNVALVALQCLYQAAGIASAAEHPDEP